MSLAKVGTRLIAIYMICSGLVHLPYIPSMFEAPMSDSMASFYEHRCDTEL